MKQTFRIILLGALFASVAGCYTFGLGYTDDEQVTGNRIDENKIRQIKKGETDSTELLILFGEPESIREIDKNKTYVYKNCKSGGSGVTVYGYGSSSGEERCNILTVILDSTGMVRGYNYNKGFEDD